MEGSLVCHGRKEFMEEFMEGRVKRSVSLSLWKAESKGGGAWHNTPLNTLLQLQYYSMSPIAYHKTHRGLCGLDANYSKLYVVY